MALVREELRIKDARMEQIAPHRRPHYAPIERMAILELRAARGLVGVAHRRSVPPHASHHRLVDEDSRGPREAG